MAEPLTLYKLMILYMLEKIRISSDKRSDLRLYPGQRVYHLFSSPAGHLRADRFRPYKGKNCPEFYLFPDHASGQADIILF